MFRAVSRNHINLSAIADNKANMMIGINTILLVGDDWVYDNMTIALYFLGKVLSKKYRLFRIRYNIFMIGLVLSVISFFLILFSDHYSW